MESKKAHPAFSAGARYERAAVRKYLRRLMKQGPTPDALAVIDTVVRWVLTRERRYGPRKGGL
jgi:hypothetical protein